MPRQCTSPTWPSSPVPTGVALAEREDDLSAWMADHEIDGDWVIAPALAGAGADLAWCEGSRRPPPSRALPSRRAWSGWPAP